MSGKTSGMRRDQHRRVGETIREVDRRLKQLQSEIRAAYKDGANRPFQQIFNGLDDLRCFLDARVFIEYPDRDGNANAAVYFDGGRRGCRHQGSSGVHGCQGCGHHQDHPGSIIPVMKKNQTE
ncbi:MAG: hypothetical protein ACOC3W_05395 [Thermodesulfobacteriota bacterium]